MIFSSNGAFATSCMFLWLVAFIFPTSLSAFCTCFRSNLVQSAEWCSAFCTCFRSNLVQSAEWCSAFCTCFRSNLVQSALITQNSSYELILNCIKQLVKYALHSYVDFAVGLAH